MSKVSTFGFTNTTDSSNEVTPKLLGMTTNYSVDLDQANSVKLNNKTAPLDAEEIVTFRSRTLDNVNVYANAENVPDKAKWIEYSVRLDDVLTTTDSADASYRIDEPIVASLAIKHPKSGNISNDIVATVFTRLVSCLMRADGTWRFDDLMRSAERPIVD